MIKSSYILSQGQIIENKYTVTFFLKKGSYAETYRVKDGAGRSKILKLIAYSKLDKSQFNESDDLLEIEILKLIKHPNLVQLCDGGELLYENQKYGYIILDFISGETLADKMSREERINPYEAKDIISKVLNGLNYLHNQDKPIIHNDITNLNVMLDLSNKVMVPKIIDFGYARFLHQSNKAFFKEGLNPFYLAKEAFNKVFTFQSDIFSVGALYYHILEGLPPWFIEISKYQSDITGLEDAILKERKKPLKFSSSLDNLTKNIILKALQPNTERRFKDVKEFIQALNGELELTQDSTTNNSSNKIIQEIKTGQGFSAIAGMDELKETIRLDVIEALNDKEKYAEYGLTIPNGMLLYGPPGCGKTFFAERMAEEIGFNFYQIKPSDIQSKWVNASQENIKNLFEEARQNAPSIIFIDELDAVVPNRDNSNINHMNTSAVNEFLAQMNNCGDDGIFIIGATNRPKAIDPAILRAGRLDKLIYLPPPDYKARCLMFKLYLEKRPREIGLDYSILAESTENYVSSDIKFLCDEASRKALKMNCRISKQIVLDTINNNKPSISISELNSYKLINQKMEGITEITNKRPGIGFNR
jgi:transitional endoplasmic reticulum ATPase